MEWEVIRTNVRSRRLRKPNVRYKFECYDRLGTPLFLSRNPNFSNTKWNFLGLFYLLLPLSQWKMQLQVSPLFIFCFDKNCRKNSGKQYNKNQNIIKNKKETCIFHWYRESIKFPWNVNKCKENCANEPHLNTQNLCPLLWYHIWNSEKKFPV